MRKTITAFLFAAFAQGAFAQALTPDQAAHYFDEIKTAAQSHVDLWGKTLYAPLMLVDRQTRHIYTNVPDSLGTLKQNGRIYEGTIPNEIILANTSIMWNGTRWAMIQLPLSNSKEDRIDLLAHELFHSMQPSLHFKMQSPANKHLEEKDARIYLRLELNALKKAVAENNPNLQKQHIGNALLFREYRHLLFPESHIEENELELNEGLAQYTGETVGNREDQVMRTYLVNFASDLETKTSFVRSFAYHTIPMYGYVLRKTNNAWNRKVNPNTDLTKFLEREFGITLPADLAKAASKAGAQYDADQIIAQETERDTKQKEKLAEYVKRFKTDPHMELQSNGMNIGYDPGEVISMGDMGQLYISLRVSASWGTLNAKSEALVSPDWNKVTVSKPTSISKTTVTGDGWTMELKEGYSVVLCDDGNYRIEARR